MANRSGRNSGKGDKGSGGEIGREDFLLWKEFTHDIEPLEEPDWEAIERLVADAPQREQPSGTTGGVTRQEKAGPLAVYGAVPPAAQPLQLDGRTEARLRRGQMPIEARLDLHGYTQDEAHRRLNDFVVRAQSEGKRCVLVITGKGTSRTGLSSDEFPVGILRQRLPLWLSMPPLRTLVLKSFPAVQRDGGTGAWYLYLRRSRSG